MREPRLSLIVLAALPAITCAQQTAALAVLSPHTFSGNVGLVTDYRFRGISQTYRQPAVQGGLDYSHSNGLYIGTWASSVSGNLFPNGAGVELDIYGGHKWEPVKDLAFDVGLLHYYYPGARFNNIAGSAVTKSGNKYDNTELYFGASYKSFSVKYSHALTDYLGIKTATFGGYCGFNANGSTPASGCIPTAPGNSRGSAYFDLNANFEVFDKTTLGLHLGHTSVRHYGPLSYSDWEIELKQDLGWATLGIAYVDTNAKAQMYRYGPAGLSTTPQATTENKDPGKGALVLSLQKTF